MRITIQIIAILTWCFYTNMLLYNVQILSNDLISLLVELICTTCSCHYKRLTINLKSGTKEYVFSVVKSWTLYKRHDYLRISLKEQIVLLNFLTFISNVLVPCDSENRSEVFQLREVGLDDPIEIFDSDETNSPPQAKKRPCHTSCVSKEARYKTLAF